MADSPGRARSVPPVRVRVLVMMLAFMAVGLLATGTFSYGVQFVRLDDRVDAELRQELRELESLVDARQRSGEADGESVDSLLRAVTEGMAPSTHEAVLALVDGEPRYRPRTQDFDLSDPATVRQVLAVHRPGGTVATTLDVDGREVRALVVSVQVSDSPRAGIFVVGSDVGVQERQLWDAAATYALASLAALALAGVVGSVVTARMLRPLESLREATAQITAQDLERRIEVPGSRDDVAALAENFNRMLARLQEGFAEQRRFLGDVGHELRTPLTIVRGTLETTDVDDPSDVQEGQAIAIDELERMGRVVEDLSELAHASRPDYVRPAPMDVDAFARSVFARISRIADNDWRLVRVDGGVARADEQRLVQAVVQLAANASRYSPPGSTIRLAVVHVAGELRVSVADEGIGIPADQVDRIFDRFARVDEGDGAAGTGLGLSIVRAIAEGHGGTVQVRSAPGRGSEFTIVVPDAGADGGAPGDGLPSGSEPDEEVASR